MIKAALLNHPIICIHLLFKKNALTQLQSIGTCTTHSLDLGLSEILVLVLGARHLRGSRLLSFCAFYYEYNIVWGVGWDKNVICTSTHM